MQIKFLRGVHNSLENGWWEFDAFGLGVSTEDWGEILPYTVEVDPGDRFVLTLDIHKDGEI